MVAPVIGITGRQALLPDHYPEALSDLRNDLFVSAYAQSVAGAGAIPLWISRAADPRQVVGCLDGLIIAGGQDVDPRVYGARPGPRSSVLDPGRDAFEIELVRAAVAMGRPLLGICRGAQLLNVALGGTLTDDLAVGAGESHAFLGYPAAHRSHAVELVRDSELAELFGSSLMVNSYHHQCIDRLGDGLRVTGRAPDGVIEAVELPDADVIGVQWHPEMLPGVDPVFSWLTDRCAVTTESETARAIA